MKALYASMGIIALIILQACSSQPRQANASQTATSKADIDKPQLINTSLKTDVINPGVIYPLNESQQLSVPEAQIIRELYQSGCIIEQIELNRRKQQMKISCASDKPFNSRI